MNQPAINRKRFFRTSLLLTIISLALSCKKTETVPYEQSPNNTILEYRVSNTTDTIFGAIDNVKNTITVYVPYYVGIDFIVPEIRIDKDAKLLDSAGNAINLDGGLKPVPLDTTGYVYTVLGSDNLKRSYTLITQILPHPDSLKAGYFLNTAGGMFIDYQTPIDRAANGRMSVYGNFGSTSTNVKFTFTNKANGKVYTNILSVYSVTPGANYYTMMLDISADADSGYYNVEMKHQGRTTQLPTLHVTYRKPKFTNLKSTSSYAPGDTVTFTAIGHSTSDTQNGSVIGLERVYMKFYKAGFSYGGSYPATFPDDLFSQQLEMKIVSVSRTEVKAIFPDVPAGAIGSYLYVYSIDFPGIGFYFDFSSETGWGTNNMLATTGRTFTINPKK